MSKYITENLDSDKLYNKNELSNMFNRDLVKSHIENKVENTKTKIKERKISYIQTIPHNSRTCEGINNSKIELEEKRYTVLTNILSDSLISSFDKIFWDMMLELNPNINIYDKK